MKKKLSILILIIPFFCSAKNYYFSSSGSDSYDGSISKPWKTITKLNSMFSGLKPSDSVLLKRGDTFYGEIIISKSGTLSQPINIDAYGVGELPIITGFKDLTWSSVGNNIWVSNEALSISKLNLVTINNAPVDMGRWPNTDNGNGGYSTIPKVSGSTTIIDNAAIGTKIYSGAEIVLRSRRWMLDRHPVSSFSSLTGTVSFSKASSDYPALVGYGYFYQNDSLLLDRQGEWYYSKNKKVKMFSLSMPAGVQAANIETLVTNLGGINRSYINFRNIHFTGSNDDMIEFSNGTNYGIKFTYCVIDNCGNTGIKTNTQNGYYGHNVIKNCMNQGMDLLAAGSGNVVENNTISDIHLLQGLGVTAQGGNGIRTKDKNPIIRYNEIYNTGFCAIWIGSNSVNITNNYLHDVLSVLNDGAAIYSYNKPAVGITRIVSNNVIINGIGAPYGTPDKKLKGIATSGIYNDKYSSYMTEEGNTIVGFEKGIFQNIGNVDIKVRYNTVYGCATGFQINTNHDNPTSKIQLIGNVALCLGTADYPLKIQTFSPGPTYSTIGIVDSNYYCRPSFEPNGIVTSNTMGGGVAGVYVNYNVRTFYSVDKWAFDKHGKKTPANGSTQIVYNPTDKDNIFPLTGNWTDVKGKSYSGTIIVKPYTSLILIKAI